MNLNERLSVDSYFSHIRQTNQLFLNYMTILERQENNLNRLLNNRNNNTTRWRNFYPSRPFSRQENRQYNTLLGERLFNTTNLPSNRLTNNEIDRFTNVCNFSFIIDPINSSCPITFEDFSPNDRVMVINHCRHIFNENSLRSWFTYNTHCPLCRHNLRQNTNNTSYYNFNHNQNQINDMSENIINDISSNFNNVFNNIINTYSNNNINTGETITTLSRGTIYNNTTNEILNDLSNNSQHILNQWNQNIMNQLSELINDDISGNIQLEYRMFSS